MIMKTAGAGRPTKFYIARFGDLAKLSLDYLINEFPNFDRETKIRVALEVAKKCAPNTDKNDDGKELPRLVVIINNPETELKLERNADHIDAKAEASLAITEQ